MKYRIIVSDWNGTLFDDKIDELQLKEIIFAGFRDLIMEFLKGEKNIGEIFNLFRGLREIKNISDKINGDPEEFQRIYDILNENILCGRKTSFIKNVIDEYAKKYKKMIDERVLRPIKNSHLEGKYTAILSCSYEYGIKSVLRESGYEDVFDDIIANKLLENSGHLIGFVNEVYGRKQNIIKEEFLYKKNLREKDIIYLGDSYIDEPIAEILPKGNFIVPFLADEDYKEKMSAKYGAFVPESEDDLIKYLKNK